MTTDTIDVEIDQREASLILEYGYPFEPEKEKLKKIVSSGGWHIFSVDKFYLEAIIGDLCRSLRQVDDRELMEELDALCDILEMAMKDGLYRLQE